MRIGGTAWIIAFSAAVFSTALQADINTDPWQFNVYTITGLGSAKADYSGASIEGIAGSGGTANLNSIGLYTGDKGTYSLYTGGDATVTSSSSNNSGLNIGGNLIYNKTSTTGDIQAGGNLSGSSGSITGNVDLGGTNQASRGLSITGTVQQKQTITNTLNASSVNSYFQQASSFWAGQPSTAKWSNVYGQIVVSDLQAGRNIVNIALSNINEAWGIQLSGPADAFVVFNVLDVTGKLNAVTYDLSGGIGTEGILFNMPNSTSLTMSGGTYASVLAPAAAVTYKNGQLQGILVADTLAGSGSFQSGSFTGFAADQSNFAVVAPEPSTYLLLATMLAAIFLLRPKRASKQTGS